FSSLIRRMRLTGFFITRRYQGTCEGWMFLIQVFCKFLIILEGIVQIDCIIVTRTRYDSNMSRQTIGEFGDASGGSSESSFITQIGARGKTFANDTDLAA